jgi:hypothetical protein
MGERAGRSSGPTEPDGVEIKLNFGSSQINVALDLFEFDPDEGKPRRIWFGENRRGLDGRAALPLSARGIIVRVREKKNSDITLKIRGPDGCLDLSLWAKRTRDLGELAKVEGDWSGERRLLSASLDGALDEEALDELTGRDPSLERLLTDEQRALAEELLLPVHAVELLGPIEARKWDPDQDGDVAAELWDVAVDMHFLEVSLRVTDDPDGAMKDLEQRVMKAGLRIDPMQNTKTTTVLRHLAERERR